ncbi:hypothetical protein FQN53_006989 [Emmonsiellopsis sp. PD_33]|nr:hypothetical protein FQN53_006989 [Emmonsiellopsis sp. PD_33]KAK2799212.1 hypothetical protein FQN51_007042 [Onygenales sp. PD_10]
MTTPPHHLPLTPSSITAAHTLIKPHIHHTPILTNKTLNALASSPHPRSALLNKTPTETHTHIDNETDTHTATPKINFFFKCENLQRIGAFKARGAFHALLRLVEVEGVEVVRERGVVTHSSGNHAQALSLASSTLSIPCTIIMPTISTPSKISGTAAHGARILFSGSTSVEREALVAEVMRETNAFLIPPYDHPDIILGQGTVGYEMAGQVGELLAGQPGLSVHFGTGDCKEGAGELDAVITPVGGGGLNAGVATYFADRAGTLVFGAEPSYQGGDDCARGLREGRRVERVSTLTVADGLRTPVGVIPWGVISDSSKVAGVYAVSEEEILAAMRLVLERMKVVIEPSAAVGVAVVLFNEEFRARVVRECKEGGLSGWDVGVVFSGGNTTVERIGELFAKK